MVIARSAPSQSLTRVDEMLKSKCSECHTSCGQCHIDRPDNVFEGLVEGHKIYKTPSYENNCCLCHGSRISEEFYGGGYSRPADVHEQAGMGCLDCHSEEEFHGETTETAANMYEVKELPSCRDCHTDLVNEDNLMHSEVHLEKIQCNVCHSQPYKNCYQCHVGLEDKGLKHESQQDFRIGRNPIKSDRHPQDYVLLRHPPIAPDTFTEWGINLERFTALPTWKYCSPHNIQKWTQVNTDCENCHESKKLLLTTEFIEQKIDEGVMVEEEIEANATVILEEVPDE
jgi:hypothetical protein